jgi:hypothetical protein
MKREKLLPREQSTSVHLKQRKRKPFVYIAKSPNRKPRALRGSQQLLAAYDNYLAAEAALTDLLQGYPRLRREYDAFTATYRGRGAVTREHLDQWLRTASEYSADDLLRR